MRKIVAFVCSVVVTGLGLWACDVENSLLGGECAPGYEPSGDRCVPIVDAGSRDGISGDGMLADGGGADGRDGTDGGGGTDGGDGTDGGGLTDSGADADGGGLNCTPPLVPCHGVCIDTSADPLNCGACDNICPSLLCSNSKCEGTVAGHIVVFGHDYQGAFSSAQRKALANAALLATAPIIKVRSYEQYSDGTAVAQVKGIITAAAQAQGRTAAYTVVTQPSDVSSGMNLLNTDVLVIYDQVNAPAATLGGIGTGWASALTTFTQNGGIVIALDGLGGASPQMPALLTNSLLLDVSSDTRVNVGTPLVDVASQDAVGQGLVSPYGAGQNTVHFACNEPNGGPVTYVVVNPSNDAATPPPVIVHKTTR